MSPFTPPGTQYIIASQSAENIVDSMHMIGWLEQRWRLNNN